MQQAYTKRDVQILIDKAADTRSAVDNLNKLQPGRELSCAITKLDEAIFWLKDLQSKTPESLAS